MVRFLVLLCLGVVLGLAGGLQSAIAEVPGRQLECPPMPPPVIHFNLIDPKPIYHHELDVEHLARMGNHLEKIPTRGSVIIGLTVHKEYFRVEVNQSQFGFSDGRGPTCIWLQDVTASLGTPTMDVYIAANFPTYSCAYAMTLEHENTHVRINKAVLARFAPRLEAALRQTVQREFPLRVEGRQRVNVPALLLDRLRPEREAMEREFREKNAVIDTPEAYRQQEKACATWLPKGSQLPNGRVVQ